MAGDKVKKGFAFYLLMFILLLVAVFLGILTFMLFSPQTDVLGFKYFTFSDNEQVVQTTAKEDIDFSAVSEIKVNAKNATVNVVKSSVTKDTIEFVNNSVGFARSSQHTTFEREIVLSNGVLTINVSEPEGFVHFSNNVQVNILIPSADNYQLKTTKLTISTERGNVNIGLSKSDKEEASAYNTITPKNISVKTNSGSIHFNKYVDSSFDSISLVTGSGSISSDIELKVKENSTDKENKISTTNGKINIANVTMVDASGKPNKNNILSMNVGNGTFSCTKLDGSVSVVISNGTVNITELTGHFSANNTKDYIDSPTINLKKVGGDVSIPNGKNAKIDIGQVDGYTNIDLDGGRVKIGKTEGISERSWISTKSGSIEAYIADKENGRIHNFESENGEINVTFTSDIKSHTNILSKSGNVNLTIRSGYRFFLEVENANGEYIKTLNKNVSFEFIDAKEYKMPFGVHGYNGTDNTVLIKTDGQIRGRLMSIK